VAAFSLGVIPDVLLASIASPSSGSVKAPSAISAYLGSH
jgi:hypothetical protein